VLSDLKSATDIDRAVRALLHKADIDDRLPTPVDELVHAAELITADDYVLSESKIRQAPKALRRYLRGAKRKILGVLDRRERLIHVSDDIEDPNKKRFVTCHETTHHILPWQRDLIVLGDTSKTLSPSIDLSFDREANQGAAELLFQRDLLARIGREHPVDISTVGALATMFGASFRSTFRRWIETHPDTTAAGLVLDPTPTARHPAAFRRFELNESSGWRERYGRRRFPQNVTALELPFLANLAEPARLDVDTELVLADRDGVQSVLRVQSNTTRHNIFVLIWAPGKETVVARHRAKPTLIIDEG
jgi:hypothetical protein